MKTSRDCAAFTPVIRRGASRGRRTRADQELQVKVYAGTAVTSHIFDWDSLPGLGVEERLSQLCRWIEDAHADGRAFGLKLPGIASRRTSAPHIASVA